MRAWRAHGTIWALPAAGALLCEQWFGCECATGSGVRRIRGRALVVCGLRRRPPRAVIELGRRCICCPLIVISALVVKNGRAADRKASASRFCGASCLIAVKQLAFYWTEMTYERVKRVRTTLFGPQINSCGSPSGLRASAARMFLTTPRKIRLPDGCAEWLRTRKRVRRSGRIL